MKRALILLFLGAAVAARATIYNIANSEAAWPSPVAGDTVNIAAGGPTAWTGSHNVAGVTITGAGSGYAVGFSSSSNTVPASFPTTKTFTIATLNPMVLITGQSYVIVTPGTTNWVPMGSANNTAGTTFTCTTPGTGTGTCTFNYAATSTLTIFRTGGSADGVTGGGTPGFTGFCYVTGTVTSYVYSTQVLTMSITSSAINAANVAVAQNSWVVTTPGSTIITCGNTNGSLFNVTENSSFSSNISGIQFQSSVNNAASNPNIIQINRSSGGLPVLLHDCFFYMSGGSTTATDTASNNAVFTTSSQGVFWNTAFISQPYSLDHEGIQCKAATGLPGAGWTTADTMGSADTTGNNNFYIENCVQSAFNNGIDIDDAMRVVMRHSIFDNSSVVNHAADTSPYGARQFEFEDNTGFFDGTAGQEVNMNYWYYIRGATGVIQDNTLPALQSVDYGLKTSINFTVQQLQRDAGPNGGWGVFNAGSSNTSGHPNGWYYPSPRQPGMGYITGTASFPAWVSGGPYNSPGATWGGVPVTTGGNTYLSILAPGTSTTNPASDATHWTNETGTWGAHNDSVTYIGDADPIYIWNNSPSGSSGINVGLSDYGANNTSSVSTTGTPVACDSTTYYVNVSTNGVAALGRNVDVFFDNTASATNGAKSGYVEYTYPHPLRNAAAPVAALNTNPNKLRGNGNSWGGW